MKLPTWRIEQLAGKRRPGRPRTAASVIARLQSGAVLRSGLKAGKRWWMVSDGTVISSTTAKAVTSDPRVVDCGDVLFTNAGIAAQTFRWGGS